MVKTASRATTFETTEPSPVRRSRRFNMASVALLLAALALDLTGKAYTGRAIVMLASGGDHVAADRFVEWSDLLTELGIVVAACGGICTVASIAKGEAGPHWPMLLAGGIYVILFLVMV